MAYPTGLEIVGLERPGGEGQDGLTLTFQAQSGGLAVNGETNASVLASGLFLSLQPQATFYTADDVATTFALTHTAAFYVYRQATFSITTEAAFNAYGVMTASLSAEAPLNVYSSEYAPLTAEASFTVYDSVTAELTAEAAFSSYQTFNTVLPAEAGFTVYAAKTSKLPAEAAFSTYKTATATLPVEAAFYSYKGVTVTVPAEAAFNVYAQAYAKLSAEATFSAYRQAYAELTAESSFYAYTIWNAKVTAEAQFNAYNAVYAEIIAEAGFDVTQPYSGWAINIDNAAVSKYEGLDFDVILPNYGCNESGVYALGGADDDGAAINAFVETGYIRFDESPFLYRVSDYYHEGTNGKMRLVVTPEKELGVTYNIAAQTTTNVSKVNLGRGAKGKAWKFKLANASGSEAEIDNQSVVVEVLSRRVR